MVQLLPPRGGSWVNFCLVCATGISEPLPHYSLFCGQLQTPSQSLLCKYEIFAIPTKSLSIYLSTLYSMKNTLLFICSTNILARLPTVNMKDCLAHKSEYVRPRYRQSSRENATPSCAHPHQPLIRKYPPPPGGFCADTKSIQDRASLHI